VSTPKSLERAFLRELIRVDSKRLAAALTSLESALTKKEGRGPSLRRALQRETDVPVFKAGCAEVWNE
jgi:hypothetical protein